jgi:protein O-mannosyl-transferase
MAKQKEKPKQSPKQTASPRQKLNWGFPLIVLALTATVYFPSLKNGFTNWDDQEYVLENPLINKVDVKAEFKREYMGNYHPLSMISLAMDYRTDNSGKPDPKPYHTTNLILHLLASFFAFLFVFNLTGSNASAFIASLLFAIHPMHVESVAWISERKDVLYATFLLAALWIYTRYISDAGGKIKWYALFTLLFLASLFSKAQAVVFPVLCLLIDYLKNRGINKKTILEKVPLFIISLIFGFKAIHAQQTFEAIQGSDTYSYFDRILFSGYGLFTYLWKLIIPIDLSTFYPYPIKENGMFPSQFYLLPLLSAALIFAVWKFFRKNKIMVFGSLFFLFSIALVLQILPVGGAVIADRYTYIPYLGLFIIIGHYLVQLFNTGPGKMSATGYAVIGGASLVFCAITWQRIGVWKDSITLWEDTVKKSTISPKIYGNLGNAYTEAKRYQEALVNLNECVRLKPDYDQGLYNRGLVHYHMGKYKEAIEDYTAALRSNPKLARAYFNRAGTYYYTQQYQAALSDALKARELGYPVDQGFIDAIKKDGGLK